MTIEKRPFHLLQKACPSCVSLHFFAILFLFLQKNKHTSVRVITMREQAGHVFIQAVLQLAAFVHGLGDEPIFEQCFLE